MKVRKQQKEKRRMQILMVGLELFVTKGYTATKVSDIAARADMSVGLLFHYFKSKENLYEELVKMGLKGTQMSMQINTEDPLVFFEQLITMIMDSIKENPWAAKMFVLMSQAQRSEGTPESVKAIAKQVNNIEQCIPIIEEGQQKGVFRKGNPHALSNAFWCSIQGMAEQNAVHPNVPLPEPEWILDIIKNKEVKI